MTSTKLEFRRHILYSFVTALAFIATGMTLPGCDKGSGDSSDASDDDDDDAESSEEESVETSSDGDEIPDEFKGKENPFAIDDTSAVSDGETLYVDECKICHAADAKGILGSGSNLLSSKIQGYDDDHWLWIISDGTKDKRMPAFRDALSEEERWKIIVYLRSLAQ
jgi:hypothetical protein